MAKTSDPTTAIIVDDELHNVEWMIEYLESKGFTVKTADNLNSGLELVSREIYRVVIIDLNIPCAAPVDAAIREKGLVYQKYPGLYLANTARNKGYRDRQIVIYSVHKDASVFEEAKKLSCTYILKGRPREIKSEIDFVVNYDPTLP